MYLVATSYLEFAGVIVYLEFHGPEDTGIKFVSLLSPGPAAPRIIAPHSPAARAGIEP